MSARLRAALGATAAAALVAAACGGSSTPVVIGAAVLLSGTDTASTTTRALSLAVEAVNATGGIRGRPLRLHARDDGGLGDSAVAVAKRFVDDDRVIAVVGHQTSTTTLAAARVYDGRLAAMSADATSPLLTGISPWIFRIVANDSASADALAALAHREGWRRVVVAYQNTLYGRGYVLAFRRSFRGAIVRADPIDASSADLDPFTRLYARLNLDAVVLVTQTPSAAAFLAAAERTGLQVPVAAPDAWVSLAESYVGPLSIYAATPVDPRRPSNAHEAFHAAFRRRFGYQPGHDAALAYDALMLLATAMRRVGPNREAVRAYLATTATRETFTGLTGPVRLTHRGDVAGWPGAVLRCGDGSGTPGCVVDPTPDAGQQ